MNEKFTLKVIQQGQAQKIHVVNGGAGIVGNAVVIKAVDAARYQLTNIVTLVSPEKIKIKRKGADLQLALPGGDIDAPDVVIQGYFDVKGVAIFGVSVDGEWSAYNTSALNASAPTLDYADISVPKADVQSLSGEKAITASLGAESFFANSWVWGGAIGLAVAASGNGGGGTSSIPQTSNQISDPLAIITAYAGGGATTAPTAAQYTSAGVTLPTISAVTADNMALAMNAVVASKTAGDVSTAAQLNALATALGSAYGKILAEANGTTADATPGSDLTSTDFASLGVIVGSTTKTLNLLNSAIAEVTSTSVNTVAKIQAMAVTAEKLMKIASGVSGITLSNAELIAFGLKVNGVSGGITADQATGLQSNLVSLGTVGMGWSATTFTDGTAIDSIADVQALLSLQVLRSFTNDAAAIGGKTQSSPTLSDYANIGITSLQSISGSATFSWADSQTSSLNPSPLLTTATIESSFNKGGASGFSLLATLNTALDKFIGDATLTKAKVQAMVNSYYRILQNTSDTSNAVTDPTAADYANIGITEVDGTALTAVTGDTAAVAATKAAILALLNDAVGRFSTTSVDTVTKIANLEKAAENVIAMAAGSGSGSSATGVSYATSSDWANGLTALGVSGVTLNNIAAIKSALDTADQANDGVAVNTIAKIQKQVSVQVFKDFTNDVAIIGSKTTPTPTLADWSAIGLKANTSLADSAQIDVATASYWKTTNPTNGLAALNSALDYKYGYASTSNALTTLDSTATTALQAIINSYGRILQEADGSRTINTDVSKVDGSANADLVAADFTNIGATVGTTTHTLQLLEDVIGGLTSTAVDTVDEINALAVMAENVMKLGQGVQGTYTDSDWINALGSKFGLTGITTSNIGAIKTAISVADAADDGDAIDTYAELQAIISMVRINDYSNLTSGYQTPTITDYQAIDSNANSSYLAAYNDAESTTHATHTQAWMKSMITSYNTILAEANGATIDATSNDPTVTYYSNIGVTIHDAHSTITTGSATITASDTLTLLNDVIANLTADKIDTISEIANLEAIVNNIMGMANNSHTAGTITSADYAGGVTSTQLLSLGFTDTATVNKLNNMWSNPTQLTNFYDKVITSADSGSGVDSLAKLQTMILLA